jgi:hypothetical protein
MNCEVAGTQLTRPLRFLFLRKTIDNLLPTPDKSRSAKFEELVSEQARHFGGGGASFGIMKSLFQLAQQGALFI